MGMPLCTDFFLQGDFSTDVEPLQLNSGVVRGQSTEFGQILQSLLVTAAIDKPAW